MSVKISTPRLVHWALGLLIMGALSVLPAGSATADLVGHWTLDDGLSDPGSMIAVDSSGNGYDGELTSFFLDPLWLNEGQSVRGGAMDFGGEPGAIVAIIGDDLPIGAEPRTLAAWINVEFAAQAFFMSYGAGGAGGQFSVGVELNGDTPNVRLRHGGGSMFFPTAVEGEWMHVAVVVPDGAEITDDVQVFIDGEESISDNPTNVALNTAESEFVIGGKWGVPENRAFEGAVDDVWLYDEALDQAAIQAIMNGGGAPATQLQAGDANMDMEFNQLDLVQVQIAAKYLSGADATWGDGDWDGAPGGSPGNPPAGNGKFDQLDIIAALGAGKYLTGPYGAISPSGVAGDGQTSVGYDPSSGEVWVDAPAGTELTSINIDSAAAIFTGDAAQNLGGSFDNDADNNIFKATFGSSFGSLSFGNVAQAGLSLDFVLGDLTVVGSLAGGGDLGSVDLCCVPEPSTVALMLLGAIGLVLHGLGRASRAA